MKKSYYVFWTVVFIAIVIGSIFIGCDKGSNYVPSATKDVSASSAKYKVETPMGAKLVRDVELDDCDYFLTTGYGGAVHLAHKGNCRSCRSWALENLR